HTYLNARMFGVFVSITDNCGGATATAISTATITGTTARILPGVDPDEGVSTGTVDVATFHASSGGPFTAMIDWGDGHVSTGTVTSNGGGDYTVSGSNTFGAAGSFPLTVTVSDSGGILAVVQGGNEVSPSTLTAACTAVTAVQGQGLDHVVVARFTDSNANV